MGEIMFLLKDIVFTKHDENIYRLIRLVRKQAGRQENNSLIIDIGAFDGKTSIHLSKAFPNCKILAFEPNSEAFELARKNCSANNNITVNNIAISDTSGQAELNVTLNQVSSSLNKVNAEKLEVSQKEQISVVKTIAVTTKTLDDLNIDTEILILKIDAQGHEKEILSGGKNTLKDVSFILVEMNNHDIYEGSSKYYEIDQLLRENNFKLVDIIVTYRKYGLLVSEYDAIYLNRLKYPDFANK